jgi:putative ABC transport system ATP-binding protein
MSSLDEAAQSSSIEIHKLNYRYPGSNAPVLAINHWQVDEAEHVFVNGPSGSGKTTLLSLVSGMLKANHGEVRVLNEILSEYSAAQRDRFRAKNIGVIFQNLNLIPWLTVEQNLNLAPYFAGSSIKKRAEDDYRSELFERLRLDSKLLSRNAAELSTGQQQRIAIVRALINRPKLIIADEPCSALDNDARDRFMELLMENITSSKAALVFVSHDLSLKQYFARQDNLLEINQVSEGVQAC